MLQAINLRIQNIGAQGEGFGRRLRSKLLVGFVHMVRNCPLREGNVMAHVHSVGVFDERHRVA